MCNTLHICFYLISCTQVYIILYVLCVCVHIQTTIMLYGTVSMWRAMLQLFKEKPANFSVNHIVKYVLHKWSNCFISELCTTINILFCHLPIEGRHNKWAASNYECLKQLWMPAGSNLLHSSKQYCNLFMWPPFRK